MSGFKYYRFLNIIRLSICQSSENPGFHRVYLFSLIWQAFEYAPGCNCRRALIIPGFRICQSSAYAGVTQDSEYTWIWLNNDWINVLNLGPLLPLIYINDLHWTIRYCSVHYFADETKLLNYKNSVNKQVNKQVIYISKSKFKKSKEGITFMQLKLT